jgi:hypothetical protein
MPVLGPEHELPKPTPCPVCGTEADMSSGITTDNRPEPNDYAICIYCAALCIYTSDLTMRPVSAVEFDRIPHKTQTSINLAQLAIRLMRGSHKPTH